MSASRLHYAWIVLAMGTLVVFGSLGLARFGYTVILPAMQQGLGLDNTQAGMLATANLVGYVALSAIGGALASRYGPRAVISVGLVAVALGMLFTGLAYRFGALLAWRFLSGLGSGASNVPVMGLLSAWFAARRRGLATGIGVSGSSIALILVGPVVPRILVANPLFGWRVSWLIFAGVTLVLAAGSAFLLRNRPTDKSLAPLGGGDGSPAQSPSGGGALRWGRVYRAAPVWHLGAVYTAFGFAYIIYTTFFTKHLLTVGYTPQGAGQLYMVMGWFSLLCGLIWGSVSDAIGRKGALILVYLIHALAFGLFALWPEPAGLTISAVLFGLTAWSIPAIMAAACGDVLGDRLAPAALGFITLFFGIGQALGPSVAGAIADATGSFFAAFLLAAGVAALGAIGAALLRKASTVAESAP